MEVGFLSLKIIFKVHEECCNRAKYSIFWGKEKVFSKNVKKLYGVTSKFEMSIMNSRLFKALADYVNFLTTLNLRSVSKERLK